MAKYSKATQVTVSVHVDAETFRMEISDNGQGFGTDRAQKGNGLRNMSERARVIRGELTVISSPGDGTSVRLQCHLTRISDSSAPFT